ncbi:MAG: alpha/beta hydrolase [Acidobacteriia bacterium]|nr:alpha/beta hydrolase [Terriglobia bacterium]
MATLAGAAYEAYARHQDERRFHPQGLLVDVGGYRLNILCAGNFAPGTPTVILESGLGGPVIGWRFVRPEIAKFARVCSYYRAGYGWSDPGPMPRTALQIAKELHLLLQNAHIDPPYIPVGYSFGGYAVRVFNGLYPRKLPGPFW